MAPPFRDRWIVVEEFEHGGERFLLARRRPSGFAELSVRERAVVLGVAAGKTNKVVAYELGITASTVGVLLGRAVAKLGVGDRAGLIAFMEKQLHDSEPPPRSSA